MLRATGERGTYHRCSERTNSLKQGVFKRPVVRMAKPGVCHLPFSNAAVRSGRASVWPNAASASAAATFCGHVPESRKGIM